MIRADRTVVRGPEADTIYLGMDNLSSHNRKTLMDRFGEKIGGLLWERFTVHFTPKHGSWLNQAEIEISLFSRQCFGRNRIPSLGQLQRQARAWNRKMNRDRVTINWQFRRKKASQKFGYERNKFALGDRCTTIHHAKIKLCRLLWLLSFILKDLTMNIYCWCRRRDSNPHTLASTWT